MPKRSEEILSGTKDEYPIDFVVTWVDGSDPAWLAEREKYSNEPGDAAKHRFRDLGLLRYWFRCVEYYAPWVRMVHFVTWGHIPDWLDTTNPKLHVVKHEEFIPQRYLPTFSSHTIEWNMHRIEGLSERFVYFNDDMFIARESQREDFFRKGLPCGTAVLQPMRTSKATRFYIPITNMALLNEHFSARSSVLRHPLKWFNLRYGTLALRTLLMMPYPHFYGMHTNHTANSFLKSTFEEIWFEEGNFLDEVCCHRFRDKTDVNQWLVEAWQYADGKFVPRSPEACAYYSLGQDAAIKMNAIERDLMDGRRLLVCINDGIIQDEKVDEITLRLRRVFDELLPNASSYEVS